MTTPCYNCTYRFGHDYITTSMTGALNMPRFGAFDHVVWANTIRNGPKIANVLLNGVLGKDGPVEDDPTVEHGMYVPAAPAVKHH